MLCVIRTPKWNPRSIRISSGSRDASRPDSFYVRIAKKSEACVRIYVNTGSEHRLMDLQQGAVCRFFSPHVSPFPPRQTWSPGEYQVPKESFNQRIPS